MLESVRCGCRVVLRSIRSHKVVHISRSLYTRQLRAGPVDLVLVDELHVHIPGAVLAPVTFTINKRGGQLYPEGVQPSAVLDVVFGVSQILFV